MAGRSFFIDSIEEDAADILAHASFQPVPYRRRHEELATRLGLDFSDILAAFDHIPLALTGEVHKRRRSTIARTLSASQEATSAELPGIVERHFARLKQLGPVDIFGDCLDPFVRDVLSLISGAPADLDLTLVSRIFSRNLGVAQRRRMQEQLKAVRERLASLYPDESEEQIGDRISLLILGRDSLIGTLARSLHDVLQQANGRRLCDCEPAVVPTRTGVPFIDREAIEDIDVKGCEYSAGDVVRCQLHALENDPVVDYRRFFGKGPHLCLGRSVSLEAFGAVGTYIAKLPVRIVEIDFALRKDDVFLYPDRFKAVVAA